MRPTGYHAHRVSKQAHHTFQRAKILHARSIEKRNDECGIEARQKQKEYT